MKCVENICGVNGMNVLNKGESVEFVYESESRMNEKCIYKFGKEIVYVVSSKLRIKGNRRDCDFVPEGLRGVFKFNVLMKRSNADFSVYDFIMTLVLTCILFLIIDYRFSYLSDTFKYLFFMSAYFWLLHLVCNARIQFKLKYLAK